MKTGDEEELVVQLEEKYENLREFNKIKEIEPPEAFENDFTTLPGGRLSMAQLPDRY